MAELVVAPPEGRPLTIYEADFLEGLALQAAVALENARNHKRNVEFARVQQDLDAARAIQRSLLPQKLPSIAGYSLGLPLRHLLRGGRRLSRYRLAARRQHPDGGGRRGRQGAGLGHDVHQLSLGLPRHGGHRSSAARRTGHAHEPASLGRRRRGPPPLCHRHLPPAASRSPARSRSSTPATIPAFLLCPDAAPRLFKAAGTPLGLLPGMRYDERALQVFARLAAALLYRRAYRGLPGG